jgi:hypothetical protein
LIFLSRQFSFKIHNFFALRMKSAGNFREINNLFECESGMCRPTAVCFAGDFFYHATSVRRKSGSVNSALTRCVNPYSFVLKVFPPAQAVGGTGGIIAGRAASLRRGRSTEDAAPAGA